MYTNFKHTRILKRTS